MNAAQTKYFIIESLPSNCVCCPVEITSYASPAAAWQDAEALTQETGTPHTVLQTIHATTPLAEDLNPLIINGVQPGADFPATLGSSRGRAVQRVCAPFRQ